MCYVSYMYFPECYEVLPGTNSQILIRKILLLGSTRPPYHRYLFYC
jgi:hypothetical protein